MDQAPIALLMKPDPRALAGIKGKGAAGGWRRNRWNPTNVRNNHAVEVSADHEDFSLMLSEYITEGCCRLQANRVHKHDPCLEGGVMQGDHCWRAADCLQSPVKKSERSVIENPHALPLNERI